MISRPVLAWVADVPTTALRILVSIVLAVCYVLGSMVLSLIDALPANSIMVTLGGFILTMMGLDVAQYWAKRATYKPSPPNTPDIEDTPSAPDPPPRGGAAIDRSAAEEAAIGHRPRAA